MKRKDEDEYKSLSIYISRFFWRRCDKCGFEYKGEHMWRAIGGDIYDFGSWDILNTKGEKHYLCLGCAKTKEDAHKYFINHDNYEISASK